MSRERRLVPCPPFYRPPIYFPDVTLQLMKLSDAQRKQVWGGKVWMAQLEGGEGEGERDHSRQLMKLSDAQQVRGGGYSLGREMGGIKGELQLVNLSDTQCKRNLTDAQHSTQSHHRLCSRLFSHTGP